MIAAVSSFFHGDAEDSRYQFEVEKAQCDWRVPGKYESHCPRQLPLFN